MPSRKVSISMPREIWNRMVQRMSEQGLTSPSAYIQQLIHNDTARRHGLEPRDRIIKVAQLPTARVADDSPKYKPKRKGA